MLTVNSIQFTSVNFQLNMNGSSLTPHNQITKTRNQSYEVGPRGLSCYFFVDITDDKKDFALFANIQRAHLLREVSNCQYCRPGLEKPDTGGDEIPSAPIEP